jgi:SAM-dependent methyltransferase
MVELPLIQALFSGKPYTGPALLANRDTGHEECLRSMVDRVSETTGAPRVLEVGSWLGGTSIQLAALFRERTQGMRLTCVEDFHAPHELASAYPRSADAMMAFYEDASSRRILPDIFRHNMKRCEGDVALCEGGMLDTLSGLESGTFDLVLLHGTRALTQFEEVLAACRRLLAEDGVLCGTGLLLDRSEVDHAGCDHGYTYRHVCFTLHDEKTKRRYYPEITAVMAREFGELKPVNGFWATNVVLPRDVHAAEAEIRSELYSVFPYGDGYAVLHTSVPQSLLGSERLGERTIPEVLEFAANEAEARERAAMLNERHLRRKGTVLEETRHYYVCKYGEKTYLAQCKINGLPKTFQIFTDRVGDYEIAPTLLTGSSLAHLKRKVAKQEAAMDAQSGWHPIQERFNGYYLYATHVDHCVAVKMDMTHGRPFVDQIGHEDLPPHVLTAPNMDVLKLRIERGRKQEKSPGETSAEPEEWL